MKDYLKELEEYSGEYEEAIKWAVDEIYALYELVAEMRMKYENIETRKDED